MLVTLCKWVECIHSREYLVARFFSSRPIMRVLMTTLFARSSGTCHPKKYGARCELLLVNLEKNPRQGRGLTMGSYVRRILAFGNDLAKTFVESMVSQSSRSAA